MLLFREKIRSEKKQREYTYLQAMQGWEGGTPALLGAHFLTSGPQNVGGGTVEEQHLRWPWAVGWSQPSAPPASGPWIFLLFSISSDCFSDPTPAQASGQAGMSHTKTPKVHVASLKGQVENPILQHLLTQALEARGLIVQFSAFTFHF